MATCEAGGLLLHCRADGFGLIGRVAIQVGDLNANKRKMLDDKTLIITPEGTLKTAGIERLTKEVDLILRLWPCTKNSRSLS